MLNSNIERLIKESGLKKKFIAGKLEVSVPQLRNYETGKSLIPIDKGFTLADLLRCKVDDLYERKPHCTNETQVQEEKLTKEEFLNEQIETLDFEPRVFQMLKRNRIDTYKELLEHDKYNFKYVRGAGPKAREALRPIINELKEIIKRDYD